MISDPPYRDVKQYDEVHKTDWLGRIEQVCTQYAAPGHGIGVYCQFRTDWITQGLLYAVSQTLRYVGFGYRDAMIFKNIGLVVYAMLQEITGGKNDN